MDKVVSKAMYTGLIKMLSNFSNIELLRQFLRESNLGAREKNVYFWKCKKYLVCPSFQVLSKNTNNNISNIIVILLL